MDELLGEAIDGRYEILQQIGEGGFGVTYLAEDQQTLTRVAVKIARSSHGVDAARRLEQEARVLARIDSQHVARFLHLGSLPDGRPFLVVEFIDGVSLDQILKAHELPISHALAVLEAVATGLAAVHALGVIHRDIKPSNIMVPNGPTGWPEFDQAKLLDFSVRGRLEGDTGLTVAGQLFGTPYYMSPEQLRGEAQSAATDVYLLGVLLYEMIYGRRPFSGESPMQMILKSLTEDALIPSTPVLPDAFRSFLQRCLSKDPHKRPDSGGSVLKEIERLKVVLGPTLQTNDSLEGDSRTFSAAPSWSATESMRAERSAAIPMPLGTVGQLGRTVKRVVIYAAISLAVIGLATVIWISPHQWAGIASGILLALAGVSLGIVIPKWFAKRKSQIEIDASNMLEGTKSRIDLSESIAIEIDQLILRVRRLDERILAKTLAVMLREYEAAVESQNRQAALMNVAQLLDKLMVRLSPWYIRHEKLIAFAISFVGVLSGTASIVASLVKMVHGR